jgi:hypothetical protein
MDTVTEGIEEARRLLTDGQDRKAADILNQAASECQDPAQAAMIKSLAEQGRERAGRFRKAQWDEAIRLAELRSESVSS